MMKGKGKQQHTKRKRGSEQETKTINYETSMKRYRTSQTDGRAWGFMASSNSKLLSFEIIDDILTRLPAKSLVRFRCLNKHWFNQLTTDSILVNKHLSQTLHTDGKQHSLILHRLSCKEFYFIPNGTFEHFVKMDTSCIRRTSKTLHIVGSSNGLICLCHDPHWSTYSSRIYLWNPATREYKILPWPLIKHQKLPGAHLPRSIIPMVALGFGFHPDINDYKVVRFVSYTNSGGKFSCQAEVYSLRKDSWKRLQMPFQFSILGGKCQAVINGIAHFAVMRDMNKFECDYIISFDLANEIIAEVPMPPIVIPRNEDGITVFRTREFKGCIYMFIMIHDGPLDIWVMKEYGVKKSWTKLSSVEQTKYMILLINFHKNGEILFQTDDFQLLSYQLESRQLKRIQIPEFDKGLFLDAVPYIETLVPLAAYTQRSHLSRKQSKVEERD